MNKVLSSPMKEDNELNASSPGSLTGNASPAAAGELAQNLDIGQKLDMMSNDFATKIDVAVNANQGVKRDVRDFSVRMEEAEQHN